MRVRITDDEGASVIKEGNVTITNRAPTGTLVVPAAKPTKTTVEFSVTDLADVDGLAAPTVAWDLDEGDAFDDGTGATASRAFDRSGSYPVRAMITDDQGQTVIKEGSMTITNQAPTATLGGPSTVATLTDATFTVADVADADGLAAPTVAWDSDDDGEFDDGTGTSVTRQFSKAGARQVKVRVTDDQGESTVLTKSVTVTNQNPTATLTGPEKVLTDEDATFKVEVADVDGSVAKVEWDLDEQAGFEVDGGTALTRTVKFAAADAERVVKVKVTDDDGGSVTAERKLVVEARPVVVPPVVDPPVVVPPDTKPPVVTPPADTTAPACTVKAPGLKIAKAIASGMPFTVSCDEAAAVAGTITLDARTAKKLGLGKKAVKVAAGKGAVAAGQGTVTVKLTSKAKRALKKSKKAIKLKAVFKLVDAAGNARVVPVTITLKK